LAGTLGEVKERLRRLPARGMAYGVARWLAPSPVSQPLAALPAAQCSFNYLGQLGLPRSVAGAPTAFTPVPGPTGRTHAADGIRPYLLTFDAVVQDGQFHLTVGYSALVHQAETINWLAERYLTALRALIRHCMTVETTQATPADYPLAGLDQAQLDVLLARMSPRGEQP
jgi:non-ribosomal peptide synthase protein (TIGR01720 family)